MGHYGIYSTRTNSGESHENGVVEQSHYRLKDAIDQALILWGSRDFHTADDYALFMERMVQRRNRLVKGKLEQELASLRPLPPLSQKGPAMLTLPDVIVPILAPFATLFTNPTWWKAHLLLVGAILATGQRTVAAALRVVGRSDQDGYARYHEVLNRAVWPPREAARILLLLLLHYLDRGVGPLAFGIDETLERRRGARIRERGIYRDAVRSSRHPLVKASGLRWISLMWLGQVPWAGHHWALTPLTVLEPSSRYYQQQGRRHRKITGWARQMVMLLRRWLPHRPLVLVGDNGYAVLDLHHCCPVSPRARDPHRQIAPGRRPLCASATTAAGSERPSTAERPRGDPRSKPSWIRPT